MRLHQAPNKLQHMGECVNAEGWCRIPRGGNGDKDPAPRTENEEGERLEELSSTTVLGHFLSPR